MLLRNTINALWDKIRTITCLLFVCFLLNNALLADTPKTDYPLEVRNFDAQKITDYKADRNFVYDREPPGKTPWEIFWRSITRILNEWVSESKVGYAFDNYIKYLLLFVMVVLVVSALIKADIGALFFRKAPIKRSLEHQLLNENIHELNFDALLEQCISAKDYRKAVRLYYLKTLKQLTDKGLLDWQINKTNHDYQLELLKTPHAPTFRQLTLLFDYVWYGEMAIDNVEFGEIRENFVQFQRKL